MKKIYMLMISAGLMLGGCASKPAETAPQATAAPEVTAEAVAEATPEATAESQPEAPALDDAAIAKLLEVYASVMDETFGIETDWANPDHQDELASYYKVTNYSTVEEIRSDLAQYIDDSLLDKSSLSVDFEEKDGVLYAIRGGRGYGGYGIATDAWTMLDDHTAEVQFLMYGDPVQAAYAKVGFSEIDGVWKVSSFELPEGYVE
ncbi:MAG: hypothetical protein K6D03_03985 [Solobacterium sp.]|nr:hypothetical protein [Solobacterium sp.]